MKKIFLLFIFLSLKIFANSISLENMISQMIIVGFTGTKPGNKWVEQLKRDIQSNKIGGVYFDSSNIENKKQLQKLIKYFNSASKNKLFMITKPTNFSDFKEDKSNLNLNQIKQMDESFAYKINTIGINMLFWPNVDLFAKYSYSNSEDIMETYALYEINSLTKYHILPVVGHFPGKIINGTSWQYRELKPFFELIRFNKIKAISMDNSLNKELDKKSIATFSSYIIKKILQNKLKFRGLVISSDLKSEKISKKYDFKQSVLLAIKAGNDILFFSSYFANSSNIPKVVKNIVIEAIKNKEITKNRIEKSYKKIMKIKNRQ